MKTIGIITFHTADNYGAVLQNYALQSAIRLIGYNAVTIDYQCDEINDNYKRPAKETLLRRQIWIIINTGYWKQKKKLFADFRKDKLVLSEKCSAENIDAFGECYEAYITGSDQVWNSNIISNNNYDAYGLGFVKKRYKFAYAASAGEGKIDDPALLKYIEDLDYITVREKKLHEYFNSIGINSKVVCDPVFLLPKENWVKFVGSKRKKNYVFLYYLDSGQALCRRIAKSIAKERNLAVCCSAYVDRNSILYKYKAYNDGPAEFLSDIYYSDIIVASSFHATAFALIFEKEFISVLHSETGDRVLDLLSYVGLTDRIIKSEEEFDRENWKSIDYSKVRNKIQKWREESIKELKRMCEWGDSDQ